MKLALEKFYAFVQQPMHLGARLPLALLVMALLPTFTAPLISRTELIAPR